MANKISLDELIPMGVFIKIEPIKIDLVYAQKNHPRNIFKTALYHDKAQLWAHQDIAKITLLAARALNREYGYILELQDCLRTVEAQMAMKITEIAKTHPEWLKGEFPLLSTPGAKSHPRAMAIDVRLLDENNNEIDMGTKFDHMDETSHRDYTGFSDKILNNRKILERAFVQAARKLGFPFLPLPSEWWDFRFPASYSEQFDPIYDKFLPPHMQMTTQIDNNIPDLPQEHFDRLAKNILNVVDENF